MKSVAEILQKIKRGTIEIIEETQLVEKLKENRPLKIKAGFDPTTQDIHLGHVVLLKKLRLFQDLGHTVYFLIGDFTARIGDPSGRESTRPPLTKEQVIRNAQTYTQQAFKILNPEKTQIVFNSTWFDKMELSSFCNLLSRYTVARLLERDDFQKRMKQNKPISMLEFVYPLLQGYDSVVLEADIEIGGSDQKFNLVCARHIQSAFGKEPQVIITLPLLIGLDGKNKMSKSLGNYIGINESSRDIFGKVMSISDELMYEWYRILTDFEMKEIKSMHPRDAKLKLAQEIVSWFYGKEKALKEKEEFIRVFSKKEKPSHLPKYYLNYGNESVLDVMVNSGLVSSKNEARRLLQQGAVSFNSKKIEEEKYLLNSPGILKIGKKKFLQVLLNNQGDN